MDSSQRSPTTPAMVDRRPPTPPTSQDRRTHAPAMRRHASSCRSPSPYHETDLGRPLDSSRTYDNESIITNPYASNRVAAKASSLAGHLPGETALSRERGAEYHQPDGWHFPPREAKRVSASNDRSAVPQMWASRSISRQACETMQTNVEQPTAVPAPALFVHPPPSSPGVSHSSLHDQKKRMHGMSRMQRTFSSTDAARSQLNLGQNQTLHDSYAAGSSRLDHERHGRSISENYARRVDVGLDDPFAGPQTYYETPVPPSDMQSSSNAGLQRALDHGTQHSFAERPAYAHHLYHISADQARVVAASMSPDNSLAMHEQYYDTPTPTSNAWGNRIPQPLMNRDLPELPTAHEPQARMYTASPTPLESPSPYIYARPPMIGPHVSSFMTADDYNAPRPQTNLAEYGHGRQVEIPSAPLSPLQGYNLPANSLGRDSGAATGARAHCRSPRMDAYRPTAFSFHDISAWSPSTHVASPPQDPEALPSPPKTAVLLQAPRLPQIPLPALSPTFSPASPPSSVSSGVTLGQHRRSTRSMENLEAGAWPGAPPVERVVVSIGAEPMFPSPLDAVVLHPGAEVTFGLHHAGGYWTAEVVDPEAQSTPGTYNPFMNVRE
jgi:hypothetical protein